MHRVRKIWAHIIVGLLVAVLGLSSTAHAAGNTISLHASASSVQDGASIQVAVRIDTDTPVAAAQAYVTFNASQLQVSGVSTAGSPLTEQGPDHAGGSGYYRIQLYKTGEVAPGVYTIATITFRALASSGTASVGIDRSQSEMGSSGPDVITGVSGTSFTLQPAPAPAPSGGGSSGSTTPKTSKPSGSTSTPSTTETPPTTPEEAATETTDIPTETNNPEIATDASTEAKNKILGLSMPVFIAVVASVVLLLAGAGALYALWRKKNTPPAMGPTPTFYNQPPQEQTIISPTPSNPVPPPQNPPVYPGNYQDPTLRP